MRQACWLIVAALLASQTVSCVDRTCDNDMGCGLDERCDTETGKCYEVDGGVAYPVDGSVVDPDGGDGGDGGTCTGPQDCTEATQPICDTADETCRACENSTECAAQVPGLPYCNTVSGACVACLTSETDCSDTTPICDDTTESCRGCNNDTDCQNELNGLPACTPDQSCVACTDSLTHCSVNNPICDQTTWTCEPCFNHSDCDTIAGGVCDYVSGACLAATDIVYVNIGVTCDDNGACDQATPCCTIQGAIDNAITAIRNTVLVSDGTYGRIDVTGTTSVWIVGAGASVQIQDTSANAQVSVVDTASLVLENVMVGDPVTAGGIGVECSGTSANHPAIELSRNTIVNNAGGGVSATNCHLRMYNNIIAGNGGGSSSFGGCYFAFPPSTADFWHNTVVNNVLTGGSPGGIQCQAAIDIRSSIISGNTNDELAGACVPNFSLIDDASGGAGIDNIIGAPTFVGGGDYHLLAGSEGIDDADPSTTLTLDIDGEPRLQGLAPDIGADEVE